MEGIAPEILFDGGGAEAWVGPDGGPPGFRVESGELVVVPGAGNLVSKAVFGDAQIHLEFLCPDMPGKQGQDRANSGVYLQGRYEVQILDSFGVAIPGKGDCGAVYDVHAPLLAPYAPPGSWQFLDLVFRAARPGKPARLTAILNGVVVQNNVELRAPTAGARDARVLEPGPLVLQDHGAPVRFRNVWLRRLPARSSDRYEPGGDRAGRGGGSAVEIG